MEENNVKITLKGRISYFKFPKSGDFSFVDGVTKARFVIIDSVTNKEVECVGMTFPVFRGVDITMTGRYVESSNRNIEFKFDTILLDFVQAKRNVNYISYLVGKKPYDNLLKYTKIKFDLKEKEVAPKAKSLVIELIEDEDIEELKRILKISFTGVVKEIIKKHKMMSAVAPAFDILGKYGLTLYDTQRFLKTEPDVEKIVEIIKNNPYKLIPAVGITFRKADTIYAINNGDSTNKHRVIAAIYEALKVGYDAGNIYLTEEELMKNIFSVLDENYFKEHVEVDEKYVELVINSLVATDNIVLKDKRYYLKENFEIQEFLKNFCKKAKECEPSNYEVTEFIEEYEAAKGFKLGKEQKQSVYDAVNHKIHIITGGAGVGKTSSLACILSYFLDEIGFKEEDICLVAPTGKAAQRMTESVNRQIGGNGRKPIIANTIHSTLKVVPDGGKLEKFYYNASNKMNCKVVVCDETSMNDYKITAALLSAIKDECRVIFLGDIGQLEPVGAGFFFRDAIESEVPTTYLNEIHRQKGESTIISVSQAIRNEEFTNANLQKKIDFAMWELSDDFDLNVFNCVKTFMLSVNKVGIDQTMLITPLRETKKNNKLDSKTLSIAIQNVYLPDVEGEVVIEKNGFKFKVGSKIIITKNNHEKGLINGEIGYITSIEDGVIIADFDGTEKALVGTDIEHIRLGYAITVHKSQGSDWKNCIYVCSKETVMNTKNLVYTAFTRAKEKLVILGNKDVVVNSQHVYPARKNSVLLNEKKN